MSGQSSERSWDVLLVGGPSGCGKSSVYLHNGDSWVSPIERAVFDLSCPKEKLTLQGVRLLKKKMILVSGVTQLLT